MQALFSEEFSDGERKEIFTIYRINTNLYEARSDMQILIVWKTNGIWDGASNAANSNVIELIGQSIDRFYETGSQFA